MFLHWGKDFLIRNLPADLIARFSETLVDPTYSGNDPIPHINGETGEIMKEVEVPGLVRVSRKKLRTFLTKGQDLDISVSYLRTMMLMQTWLIKGSSRNDCYPSPRQDRA
jgi:hypothetical protein